MHRGADDVLTLIAHIYDAAFEPQLWPQVVSELTDAVGGAQAVLGIHGFSPHSVRMIAPRLDPAFLRSYCDHWGESDIQWQHMNRMPVGRVTLLTPFVASVEVIRTDFYNEWCRPLGLGATALGVNLFSVNGLPVMCGIKPNSREDAFTDQQVALFSALVPHLSRAAEIHYRLWRLELPGGPARSDPEARSQAVIIVDAQARVLFANDVAEELLREREGLAMDASCLSTTTPDAAWSLKRLIGSCAGSGDGSSTPGGALSVARRTRSALKLVVAPLPRRNEGAWWYGCSQPAAVILISDPDRERDVRASRLRQAFSLTAAEARLALEICAGGGRAAAAARLQISPGTARIHLQRVFEKTGVHRQAELVEGVMDDDDPAGPEPFVHRPRAPGISPMR
jgi:DNA-binding CsgD family transcriptional regulator